MQMHEYLALPAPRRGQKVKGLKTPTERYAHEMTTLLNDLAAEGWEYCRSECLPSEERKGLMGTTVVQNHLLIFRRPKAEVLAEHPMQSVTAPEPVRSLASETPVLDRAGADRAIHDSRREPQIRTRMPNQSDS